METNDSGRRATPYRAVWRWHFYAGLFVAPVLLILSITGAMYLFDWEVDGLMHHQALQVEPRGAMQNLATQEAAVRAAYPGSQITSMSLPRAPDMASRWIVTVPDGRRELFVDPYTARVQAEKNPDLYVMNIARKLHGTLLSGDAGSYVVEMTACWTLVMLATGLYLWWPKSWRVSAFKPRAGATGRAFWRDWHAIPAMFNAALVLLLVLTGLPWSVFWGVQFAKLGEQLPLIAPSPNFTAGPPAGITGLPWSLQHHATPEGTHVMVAGIAPVEAALSGIDVAGHGPGVKVNYPARAGDVFIASYVPAKAEHQRTLYVDAGDGRVLGSIGWNDYSPAAKAIEWGVMTHMGRQYGLANQLAGLAVCLVLVGTTVAGLILWWKRRPRGALAAPERKAGDRLPRSVFVTLVLLGVLFPLLGASLLLVALIDRYAAARFSGLGRPTA
jgi:uncharacterized iron-regulated membrane protein